ncbi:hypothetical protein KEM48_012456 [Puccinia striiformis f. sp. tritici PST-130]|nr:hypothetical protein KEM48_012456 [Puccinia striiformis f. sp. tritici PST-130]
MSYQQNNMGSDQQNNTRYYQHNSMRSHPNQNSNPHSHNPDPNNGPPPAINYTARPNNAPANNQHTANLAIQSAPPANYYHQQPATDHGTHPNHQSLQQHYSGAPPADQSARGHNNGAPWPNVYVSHNNYGTPPANESALDPNYGAPATDHGTHPNHQSLQQHYSGAPPADQLARGHNNGAPWPNVYVSHNNYGAPPANESALDPNYGAPPAHQSAQGHNYGAPQANQYVPQPPTNNYAPWPNEYVEHHNHSTQETSYVRLQQGAHRGYPQISKQPTIAQVLAPWGLIPSQAMAFSNNFKHHRISHKSTPSWTCCQTLRTWFIQLASSTSWVQGFLPTVHLTIWTTRRPQHLGCLQMFKIHLRQTFTWMLVWISWVFGRMLGRTFTQVLHQ